MTTVADYASAESFLAGGRNKNDRPIANHTRIHRINDGRGIDSTAIAVKLHGTDVVIFREDGSVELNTGGWLTVTTKDRINTYIGDRGSVWSDRGVWYVSPRGKWDRDDRVRYFDGIRIARDGTILNPKPPETETRQAKAEDAMTKRVGKYIDGYMKALAEGMPKPSGGDCWDCGFQTDDGRTMGDLKDDQIHGHLFSHMTERYYVPSLLWNAMKEKGYRDVGFVMGMDLDREAYEAGTMRVRRGWNSTEPDRFALKTFRQALRKYLMKRLVPSRAH